MFYNCINLEYINLKKSTFKFDLSINNIFSSTSDNLMICTNQNDERLINSVGSKKIVYCNNYVSIHENNFNCYMKNPTINNEYFCNICGENFVKKENNDGSYIDCFEQTEGYYLDEEELVYKKCFYSCKTCELKGNEVENNCIECKHYFIYEFEIDNSNYKNCYLYNINEDPYPKIIV